MWVLKSGAHRNRAFTMTTQTSLGLLPQELLRDEMSETYFSIYYCNCLEPY